MDEPTSDPDSDTGGEGDAETPVHPDVDIETDPGTGDDGVTGTVIDTVAGTPVYTEPEADAEEETDADWMDPVDRRLLEFMHSEDVFEPTGIEEEGICPAKYAAYRCRELAKYGLLNRLMPGVYEVTDAGERYLADNLDPSELEPDE